MTIMLPTSRMCFAVALAAAAVVGVGPSAFAQSPQPATQATAPQPATQATAPQPATPATAPQPGTICGRSADVSQLLLSMQKASVENLFRDKMMFVLRDQDDSSVWAFSIKHTTVHPAARCRRDVSSGDTPRVEIEQVCGASEKACASFASQADERFKTLAVKAQPAVPVTTPAKTSN